MTNFGANFNEDIAAIITGTNLNEAAEFMSTYVSFQFIFCALGGITASLYSFYLLNRWQNDHMIVNNIKIVGGIVGLISIAICFALSVRNPIWQETFIGKFYTLLSVEKTPDLKKYYTHPVLENVGKQPQIIVLIIGESFSRDCSSLYGYEKQTNPYLSSLKENGLLYTFECVESVATNTIPNFKSIMAAWRMEYQDSLQWYECTTMPEVMRTAGYATSWVSNQSAKGLFDNVVGRYAELCDTSLFVGNKFSGMSRKDLDEETIGLVQGIMIQERAERSLYFIHLMGSHTAFKSRYPAHFDRFKPADYLQYPGPQRKNRAEYDNSILYNDSVVCQLMDLFKDKEAIVFYFSDHGLDIYKSSDDYMGHGKTEDAVSAEAGKRIPFMIYATPLYQQHFPEMMELINSHTATPFQTDKMIEIIMKVAGVQYKNG